MAKKARRVRRAKSNRSLAQETEAAPKLSAAEQFELEYSYVIKDLRQILILAVIMFALLIALNLFLS